MTKRPKPIVLTVLDGWGYRAETKGNAIALARKPAYDELIRNFPSTLIHTSGPFVGLPEGQMGNSEVGHMNMGAGRIVHMDITRIDLMIANKQLQNVPLFQQAVERGRQRQLHFLGLLSDGGVHARGARDRWDADCHDGVLRNLLHHPAERLLRKPRGDRLDALEIGVAHHEVLG